MPDGDGMSHARLRFIGCYDYDPSQILYGLDQVADARGRDPVVVGDQDDRLFGGGLGSGRAFCHGIQIYRTPVVSEGLQKNLLDNSKLFSRLH